MKLRTRFLKLAAFLPTIAVVGAFIGCRTGALDRFTKPEPLPEPQPLGFNAPPPADPQPDPTGSERPPVFMSGSKSPNMKGITVGLTPAGTFTPDLDVPVREPSRPAAPNAPKP